MPQPGMLPEAIVERKIIVVEGPDDRRFLGALLRHLALEAGFQIIEAHGKDRLGSLVRTLPLASGFVQVETLAIFRDADDDPRAAFQSLRNSLHLAGLNMPVRPALVVRGKPSVGIFIWPDCKAAGTLETLCLTAISGEPVMDCVREYVHCVQKTHSTPPTSGDKARLHAFLASCNRPGLRLGEAAEAGYFPWNSPIFDPLKQFLCAL
ncbi:MAG: hypothetical protein Kow00106_09970 [Anaerolineae bacterium]